MSTAPVSIWTRAARPARLPAAYTPSRDIPIVRKSAGRSCARPFAVVHLNDPSYTNPLLASPIAREPSPDTAEAWLLNGPPGRSPRPTMPAFVHRKASGSKFAFEPYPTTTDP